MMTNSKGLMMALSKYLIMLFVALMSISSQAATVRYQHTDMLGSVVAESDASGNIISRSQYEPFGKRLGGDKEGIGYTGHLQDKDLGLTYMQARYYDPLIGRFYANDPMGWTQKNPVMSFNRYLYVNNNPYKYNDPDGEFLNFVIGAAAGAIINAGAQLIANGGDFSNVDYTQVTVAAGVGATGVGVGEVVASSVAQIGLSGGAAVAANIVGNAVGGAGVGVMGTLSNTAIDGAQGDSSGAVSMGQLGTAAITGAAYSAAGVGVEASVKAAFKSSNLFGAANSLTQSGENVGSGMGSAIANSADAIKAVTDELNKRP